MFHVYIHIYVLRGMMFFHISIGAVCMDFCMSLWLDSRCMHVCLMYIWMCVCICYCVFFQCVKQEAQFAIMHAHAGKNANQYNTIQIKHTIQYNAYIHTRRYKEIQYNTIQYNIIQYNTIQYNTIQYNMIKYNTNTIQYNTIQYNTIQYNTIQNNTIQYNTKQNKYNTDTI